MRERKLKKNKVHKNWLSRSSKKKKIKLLKKSSRKKNIRKNLKRSWLKMPKQVTSVKL